MLLLLPVLCVNGQPAGARSQPGKTVMSINAGGQFREAGKTDWHRATVPGCVHTDLLANKLSNHRKMGADLIGLILRLAM